MLLLAFFITTPVPGATEVNTQLDVRVGDAGPFIPAPLTGFVAGIQDCPKFKLWGFEVDLGEDNPKAVVKFDGMTALSDVIKAFANGLSLQDLFPQPSPCAIPLFQEIAKNTTNSSLYAFHGGGGGPVEQRLNGTITVTDRIVIESAQATTLHLPVTVSGYLVAAESFGDVEKTVAKGTLTITGSAGGSALNSQPLSVESVTIIPDLDTANTETLVPIEVQPGVNTLDVSVVGNLSLNAVAQSAGAYGLIVGAATVGGDVGVGVGNFTGSALPEGLLIYSEDTGVVYADTRTTIADTDGDGIANASDNCPFVYNPDQKDSDGDGAGDLCDELLEPPSGPEVVTLTATVRDFLDSHPDFEDGIATDRGFVASTIGSNRKPVYIGGSGTATTHGQEHFDQWYNDTPGVNLAKPLDLTLALVPGSDGVYRFTDTSFFPIDNQLFGNQGRAHNYHFTLELHSRFTHRPGLTFTFTGDDDVFVFINDQLVIDLGGVHGAQTASVDLDTLGLTPGNSYSFDLFFAERHTVASSFSIDTTIEFIGDLADCNSNGIPDADDIANGNSQDCDANAVPDECDNDSDHDRIPDACDAFPDDVLNDVDGDGIDSTLDNCALHENPDQLDSDNDGMGDVCDVCVADPQNPDADGDSVCDDVDNCPALSNPQQEDGDEDGVGDVCDNCPEHPNPDQADSNGDGIGDACSAITVLIDVKPGSDPNCFNINGRGVIPVAILGEEDFDVTLIDQSSLLFGGLATRMRGNKGPLCSLEYSNNDAYLDLVCHFEDEPSKWVPGDSEAVLTGRLLDATSIEGTDLICVVP